MPRAVVYLRFPRNRNGFQDPPIVEWNAHKEKELWSMLKNTNTDLEWHELANYFGVSVVYLLQQAAWLYEKELGMLRRRMSRISTSLPTGDIVHDPYETPKSANSSRMPSISYNNTMIAPFDDSSLANSNSEDNLLTAKQASDSFNSLDNDREFPSHRLLSASRIVSREDDSSSGLSDGGSIDGFLPSDNDDDAGANSSSSSTNTTVSQSALEAALMEQEGQSETSEPTL